MKKNSQTTSVIANAGTPAVNIGRFLKIQANRQGGALLMQAHTSVEEHASTNIARFLKIQASRNGGALLMQAHSSN